MIGSKQCIQDQTNLATSTALNIPQPTSTELPPIRRVGIQALLGTYGTNLLIQGLEVLQGVLLARSLGPTGRGELAAAILWPTTFAAIGTFGINTALARRASREDDLEALTRTALLLSLSSTIIVWATCWVSLPWLLETQNALVLKAAALFTIFALFNHLALNLVAIDQGSGNFWRYNWSRFVLNPVYLCFIMVLYVIGNKNVFWFVFGLLIANGVATFTRLAAFIRHSPFYGPICSIRSVLKESLAFGLADFVNPLYLYADRTLLLYLLGTQNLGFYTVALAASGCAGSLATATKAVTFGMAAQAKAGEGFDRVAKLFRCTAWIWIILGAALTITMPILLPLVFGREFASAICLAIWLIPASSLAGLAGILEQALRAQGRAFVGLEARLAGFLTLLAVSIPCAKVFDSGGIVLGANAGNFVLLAILALRTRSHFHQPLKHLIPKGADVAEIWNRLCGLVVSQGFSIGRKL